MIVTSFTHTAFHVPFPFFPIQVFPPHPSSPLVLLSPSPSTLFLISPSPPSCLSCFSHTLSSSKTYEPLSSCSLPIPNPSSLPFLPSTPPSLFLLSLHSTPFFMSPSHSSCPAPHLPLSWPCFLCFRPHSLSLSLFLMSLHTSSSPPITLLCHSLQFLTPSSPPIQS